MQRDRSFSDRASRRTDRGPRPVIECGLTGLARKAGEREALDRALRQTLPLPLREQVRFAHLRGSQLVFLADSPAWASRLRLMQARIIDTAQAIGVSAGSITVKVAPPDPVPPEPNRSKPLSSAAAKHLKAAAKATSDAELRALFLYLASLA